MNYFYANDPSLPEGPVSRDDLIHLLEQGKVSEKTWVREENSTVWLLLVNISVFESGKILLPPKDTDNPRGGNSVARDIAVGLFVTVVGGIVLALVQRPVEQRRSPLPSQKNVSTAPTSNRHRVQSQAAQVMPTAPSPAHDAAMTNEEPVRQRPIGLAVNEPPTESGAGDTSTPQQGRRDVTSPPAVVPTTVPSTVASKLAFEVPSRLEPQLTDEYWTRELESSMRGQGRITPELHRQHDRAIEASKQGRWGEAQELWADAVEMSLCCGDYLNYNLAVARANGGDWTGAVEPLKTASGFGDLGRSGYALGVVYARLGRWQEAAEALRGVGVYSQYSRRSQTLLSHVEATLKEQWKRGS